MNNKLKYIMKDQKLKTRCRHLTNKFIKKNPKLLIKQCKKCNSLYNLQIHHDIYPTIYEGVEDAIKEGKIYYVCSGCHGRIPKIHYDGRKNQDKKELILNTLEDLRNIPTSQISKKIKCNHYYTTTLLEELLKDNKINRFQVGKYVYWDLK